MGAIPSVLILLVLLIEHIAIFSAISEIAHNLAPTPRHHYSAHPLNSRGRQYPPLPRTMMITTRETTVVAM